MTLCETLGETLLDTLGAKTSSSPPRLAHLVLLLALVTLALPRALEHLNALLAIWQVHRQAARCDESLED